MSAEQMKILAEIKENNSALQAEVKAIAERQEKGDEVVAGLEDEGDGCDQRETGQD